MSVDTTDSHPASRNSRDVLYSMLRGSRCRCPSCGKGRIYRKYLKIADTCSHCGEELHHHRADDAPPYFTIFIVGHLVVPLAFAVERYWKPELWIHMLIWSVLTVVLCLALLPVVKGAIVGLQWALRMHGFALYPLQKPTEHS